MTTDLHPTTRPAPARAGRIVTSALTTLLAVGLLGGSTAAADTGDLRHGYEPSHADGWFDHAAVAVRTAADTIGHAPVDLCTGYETGLPDGCWTAGPGVAAASAALGEADESLVPRTVR